jgi:hypothetical protein
MQHTPEWVNQNEFHVHLGERVRNLICIFESTWRVSLQHIRFQESHEPLAPTGGRKWKSVFLHVDRSIPAGPVAQRGTEPERPRIGARNNRVRRRRYPPPTGPLEFAHDLGVELG